MRRKTLDSRKLAPMFLDGLGPTPEELERARAFVAARHWAFARTYVEVALHEYTARFWRGVASPEQQAEFEWFVVLTRTYGFTLQWRGSLGLYFFLDGWKYWTMGWPVVETTVINRAMPDDGWHPSWEKYRPASHYQTGLFGEPARVEVDRARAADEEALGAAELAEHRAAFQTQREDE